MEVSHGDTVAQSLDELKAIQEWYRAQCNGSWEHQFGVNIQTLDNPGWLVRIDLSGTPLLKKEFKEIVRKDKRSRDNWMECRVEAGTFTGAGGPLMLSEILQTFLNWTETLCASVPQ